MPTSVPVWAATAPQVDLTGRSYAVLVVGVDAVEVAGGWLADLRAAGLPLAYGEYSGSVEGAAVEGADGNALGWVADQAGSARVGWRLAVAGPEDVVLRVCAAARAAGALDAEITAHATSAHTRQVWCAHCRTTTATPAAVGGRTRCAGCGVELQIDAHVSRQHASYLGFAPDADPDQHDTGAHDRGKLP